MHRKVNTFNGMINEWIGQFIHGVVNEWIQRNVNLWIKRNMNTLSTIERGRERDGLSVLFFFVANKFFISIQFSSVPQPAGLLQGHENRFSRDLFPLSVVDCMFSLALYSIVHLCLTRLMLCCRFLGVCSSMMSCSSLSTWCYTSTAPCTLCSISVIMTMTLCTLM